MVIYSKNNSSSFVSPNFKGYFNTNKHTAYSSLKNYVVSKIQNGERHWDTFESSVKKEKSLGEVFLIKEDENYTAVVYPSVRRITSNPYKENEVVKEYVENMNITDENSLQVFSDKIISAGKRMSVE